MAGKVIITAETAKITVRKVGRLYRINSINFRPSEYPNFTRFLEDTFSLEEVHNYKKRSGSYLLKVDKDKKEDFLEILSNGMNKIVNLESSCETLHIGTKK